MPRIQPDDSVPLPSNIENSSFTTMSTLFRTMARRPNIMQSAMRLLEDAMRTGTIEPELKELLAIRVSQVNNCFY